jgi:hypothetical protein
MLGSADTLITYERSYKDYYNFTIYKDSGWTAEDPRKIWHIIHTTPEDKVGEAVREAHKRGAGLVKSLMLLCRIRTMFYPVKVS